MPMPDEGASLARPEYRQRALDVENGAFPSAQNLTIRATVHSLSEEVVERCVVVRVVMKRHNLLCPYVCCKLQSMAVGTVPPSSAVFILSISVPSILDQEIRPGRKIVARDPFRNRPSPF